MREYIGGKIMHDTIEVIGNGTLIHHGKHSNRVYLMKLDERDISTILDWLYKLAYENKYTKIFCKIPKRFFPLFLQDNYILEAFIPKFYNNKEDVFFVSKFLNPERLLDIGNAQLKKFSELLSEIYKVKKNSTLSTEFQSIRLSSSYVEQITEIYREVFVSYPFPIHHPEYILKTMNENVQYYGIKKDDKLIAVASSEMDVKGLNAEMTDFATCKDYLGNNLSGLLLKTMEKEMKKQGMRTLYTIARLNSIPMNKTFITLHYNYSGTLINNTNIAGGIESMNVYYKRL